MTSDKSHWNILYALFQCTTAEKNGSVAHLVLLQLVSAAMFEQECEEIVWYLFGYTMIVKPS